MKKLLYAALLLGAAMQFTACESDKSPAKPKQRYDLTQGMLIANEGSWGYNNASISLYYTNGDSLTNDVYNKVNKEVLGDVLQSIAISDTTAYLVVNSSNKIVAVSKYSCKKYGTIVVSGPRYMVADNQTGYVTAWTNNEVAVLDLATNKVTGSIAVGKGPEGIILNNGKLFVANSGGYDKDNTVSVIDIKTKTVVKTIQVADCPKTFVADKNGNIWVVCAGYTDYKNPANSTNGALCKINPSNYEVSKVTLTGVNPDKLQADLSKENLYYSGSYSGAGIYKMSISGTSEPKTPFINGSFYSFNINPHNGEIVAMIVDWKVEANNKMVRYSNTGSKIKEYTVGVGPNGGYFFN
jgi:YVTN family beta-propeller protein